jgi:hypothetical protein
MARLGNNIEEQQCGAGVPARHSRRCKTGDVARIFGADGQATKARLTLLEEVL